MTRHLARAAVLLAAVVGLLLNRASDLSYAGPVLVVTQLVLVGLVRYSWRVSGYVTAEHSRAGSRAAAVAGGVALLLAAIGGTASAQDTDPTVQQASTEPTVVVEPSPSPTPVEPTPEPTTTPTTATPTPSTAASTTPVAPTNPAAAAPSSSARASTSASRPASRHTETGAGAAAVPGPAVSSTSARPTSTRYSQLVPWVPADDHPEIFLIAVLLMAVGGIGVVWRLERGQGRNTVRDRYDLTR